MYKSESFFFSAPLFSSEVRTANLLRIYEVTSISVTRNILARLLLLNFIKFVCFLFEQGDLSFAQVMMMMNQRLFSAMLFVVTSTHIIGLLNLMIFKGGIQNVLIQKVLDTGVMKQMMRVKYLPRLRYLWHVRLLD